MTPASLAAPVVRHLGEMTAVPCPCGASTRLITSSDQLGFNLHITEIEDSIAHYHRHSTEVYTILEGSGTIELDAKPVAVGPGSVVVIPPYVRHRLKSLEPGRPVRVHIVGFPAWQVDDEHFD